ncbi:MAG: hypothetical protein Q8918_01840 [Bacteroidota bacterium]|nr:hypothetical protein [Bacteroidota bacterium]MDP4213820.1 hypothetical protein [Bacteroidota bacterium]MDP4248831.1 hypothetical protein [Bacteroidota bacterium]
MKKILSTAIILSLAFAVQAQPQEVFDPLRDRQLYFDILNISAVLTGMYLISSFILQIFKQHYNYRIKNRMLDKGTEENIVRQLLQPGKKENKNGILQWFFMLAAIGAGLLLVTVIRPFGLHSLAILAFSLAAGFGGYYYFSRERG